MRAKESYRYALHLPVQQRWFLKFKKSNIMTVACRFMVRRMSDDLCYFDVLLWSQTAGPLVGAHSKVKDRFCF